LAFITFIGTIVGPADKFGAAVDLGTTLVNWLISLDNDRGGRAELKRAELDFVPLTRQYNLLRLRCLTDLDARAPLDDHRLAAVAAVVSALGPGGRTRLGPFLRTGGLSEARLRSLVRSPDLDGFVRSLRSAVDIAGRRAQPVDPRDVAHTVYRWDSDRIRKNLMMSYYDADFRTREATDDAPNTGKTDGMTRDAEGAGDEHR
jgi:CRISPR type I-E-associated protein CasB/Cse2